MTLFRDVRYAFRLLLKGPGFTVIAVLILGLGIGANSTMLTLVHGLFMAPPAGIGNPGELVRIHRTTQSSSAGSLSYPDFAFYRDNNDVFSGLTAYGRGTTLLTAKIGERLVPVDAQLVAGDFFGVMQIGIAAGRGFTPEEDRVPDTHPVVVVSHGFWQRELGGISNITGAEILLNGKPFTVVGAVGPDYRGAGPSEPLPDIWLPFMMRGVIFASPVPWTIRVPGETDLWIEAFGRLDAGRDVAGASVNMIQLATRLAQTYPAWNAGTSVYLTPTFQYHPNVAGRLRTLSRLLLGVAGLVLLIACANVAILLLSRATGRQREVGVRLALGAGRKRIVRQLLVESMVLASLGAVAGLVMTWWAADLAFAFLPITLYVPFQPNITVVALTAAVAVIAALLFGLAPAWATARSDLVAVIKGVPVGPRRSTLRNGLVVAQVALAVPLLMSAGLFLRSLQSANSVPVGFDAEQRVSMRVNLRNHGYTPEQGKQFVRQAIDRIRAIPGVAQASVATRIPLSRSSWGGSYAVEGMDVPDGGLDAGLSAVGPRYFETMGIPLTVGRDFQDTDDELATPVAVVNDMVANDVIGDSNPLGRFIVRGSDRFEIVGVVRSANYYSLGEQPQPYIYFSEYQVYRGGITFVVHAQMDPAAVLRQVEGELRALDPNLAVSQMQTMDNVLGAATSRYRTNATVLSLFGMLALVLAAIGLYGVLSFTVAQRARDLSIQMALGARRARLAGIVVGLGVKLAALGVMAGGIAGWLITGALGDLLFAVGPRDPLSYGMAPALLIGVAAVASFMAARRAITLDPITALRSE